MITMPGNNQIMKYFENFCKLKCFRVQEKNVYNNERVQPLKESEGNRKKKVFNINLKPNVTKLFYGRILLIVIISQSLSSLV
jgi:hypothetical protein